MSDVSEIPKMDFDRVLDKDESEIDRNIKIHITHFVNPHCFFFKLDIQLHNLPLYEIEGSLAVHAKNIISKQSNNRYTPKIGEIVGAYVITWNKWIRAQVRTISPERLNYQYILWAIDHGKRVETIDKFLVPLPDAIKNKSIDSVYQGSIRSYGPAENVISCPYIENFRFILHFSGFTAFSFHFQMYVSDQLKYILTPSNEWSQKAIDISEQLIANKSGTYLEMIARNGKYFFGDLHVEHKNGQRINIVECLSQMNLTLHKPNFQNGKFWIIKVKLLKFLKKHFF